jgi:hypothetical protein
MFDIINRASSQTGNGPIQTIDDNSQISNIVRANYEGIVTERLTQHAWKFARTVTQLTQLNVTPELPWTALFATPPDCLSLAFVQTDKAVRVDHEERNLPTGRAIAVIDPLSFGDSQYPVSVFLAVYTARVAEDRWPADFAMAIQLRMEAVFLRGVNEQHDLAEQREAHAEKKEMLARVRDKRASTDTDPSEWDLTAARNRGPAWSAWRSRGGR